MGTQGRDVFWWHTVWEHSPALLHSRDMAPRRNIPGTNGDSGDPKPHTQTRATQPQVINPSPEMVTPGEGTARPSICGATISHCTLDLYHSSVSWTLLVAMASYWLRMSRRAAVRSGLLASTSTCTLC